MAFLRGAIPTPKHILVQAAHQRPHRPLWVPPAEVAMVPSQLNIWGNSTYGDCVSAEEAWAIAAFSVFCGQPERFVSEATVVAWARKGGFLDGANLTDVMDAMAKSGMTDGANNTDDDGPYTSVDFSNEAVLQSALSNGPVKVGIDANALPSGAGNQQGWVGTGGRPQQYTNEDHCVGLGGYGTAGFLFDALKVSLPSSLSSSTPGYLLFTWATLGFVDHAWIMSTMSEAWLRNPTTVGLSPKPQINPTPWGW